MIVKLLDYLNKGNNFSDTAVQKNLGLSEFMTQTYKERLIKGGYLKRVDDLVCNAACSSCAHKCHGANLTENKAIMWEITEKGYSILKKSEGGIAG